MEHLPPDRVALVTGAAGSIGSAISRRFARAGMTVVLTDLEDRVTDAHTVAREIIDGGGRAVALPLDVANAADATRAIDATLDRFGRLDVLVNNAAWRVPGPALEGTVADWDRTIDVTLRGTYTCSVAAARAMEGGRIVNIASQLGLVGIADAAAYTAAKGGVVNLTRSLALEWADRGITVNAVAPGPIDTPMLRDRLASLGQTTDVYTSRIALDRLGTADDVAGAVLFLTSDDASFITGHVLVVDGGWTAM